MECTVRYWVGGLPWVRAKAGPNAVGGFLGEDEDMPWPSFAHGPSLSDARGAGNSAAPLGPRRSVRTARAVRVYLPAALHVLCELLVYANSITGPARGFESFLNLVCWPFLFRKGAALPCDRLRLAHVRARARSRRGRAQIFLLRTPPRAAPAASHIGGIDDPPHSTPLTAADRTTP